MKISNQQFTTFVSTLEKKLHDFEGFLPGMFPGLSVPLVKNAGAFAEAVRGYVEDGRLFKEDEDVLVDAACAVLGKAVSKDERYCVRLPLIYAIKKTFVIDSPGFFAATLVEKVKSTAAGLDSGVPGSDENARRFATLKTCVKNYAAVSKRLES